MALILKFPTVKRPQMLPWIRFSTPPSRIESINLPRIKSFGRICAQNAGNHGKVDRLKIEDTEEYSSVRETVHTNMMKIKSVPLEVTLLATIGAWVLLPLIGDALRQIFNKKPSTTVVPDKVAESNDATDQTNTVTLPLSSGATAAHSSLESDGTTTQSADEDKDSKDKVIKNSDSNDTINSLFDVLQQPVLGLLTFVSLARVIMELAPVMIKSKHSISILSCICVTCGVWALCSFKAYVIKVLPGRPTAAMLETQQHTRQDTLDKVDISFSIAIILCGLSILHETRIPGFYLSLITVGSFVVYGIRDNLALDLLGGVSISYKRLFDIGDKIEVLPDRVQGVVIGTGIAVTTLRRKDGSVSHFRNSYLADKVVTKLSKFGYRFVVKRWLMEVDDLSKMGNIRNAILQCLLNNKKVSNEKSPECYVSNLYRYSMQLIVKFVLVDGLPFKDVSDVEHDITLECLEILRNNGVVVATHLRNKRDSM